MGKGGPEGHRRRRARRARRRAMPAGAPVERTSAADTAEEFHEAPPPPGVDRPPAHKVARGGEHHRSEWED